MEQVKKTNGETVASQKGHFVKKELYDVLGICFESTEAVMRFVELYNKAKEGE